MEKFELSHLQNLLKKSQTSRTAAHIKKIQSYLRTLSFFQDIKKDLTTNDLINCCKCLQSKSFFPSEVIYDNYEIIDKVFIVLKGKVVYKNLVNQVLKSFSQGMIFAEDLLNGDPGRGFRIIAETSSTILGYFTKEDYYNILGKYREERRAAISNFLQAQKHFSKWPKGNVIELCKHIYEENYEKGTILFNKNDLPSEIFIISDGELICIDRDVKRKGPGDIVGLEDLKENKLRSFTCVVSRKSILFVLCKCDYVKIQSLWMEKIPSSSFLDYRQRSESIRSRKIIRVRSSSTYFSKKRSVGTASNTSIRRSLVVTFS